MIKFLNSSLGLKYRMALTGFLLFGFVVTHLLGNLQIYAGPETLNAYAEKLEELGPLLWVARIGLIAIFVAHLVTAFQLKLINNKARPQGYHHPDTIQASLASRSMLLSGLVILAYILYHLAHFTFVCTHPELAVLKHQENVYGMVIAGFSNPLVSGFYVLAQVFLAAHLSHGISSVFQTFGLNQKRYRCTTRLIGPAIAGIITLGYISIPVAVLAGFLHN